MESQGCLRQWMEKKRDAILTQWLACCLEVYPAEAAGFMKGNAGKFANPVGSRTRMGIEELYDGVVQEPDEKRLHAALDAILRVRAVQDMKPSQAVSFIPRLRHILKTELAAEKGSATLEHEWPAVELRIDHVTLLAFDVYQECRERLYEIKLAAMTKRCQTVERMLSPESSGKEIELNLVNTERERV